MIDTRKYQWMIGAFGLALVIAFSVYLYTHGTDTGPGVAVGQRMHPFVAPLATSNLDLPANLDPVCNPRRPTRRGLNVCGRDQTVVAFFAADSRQCIRSVDALQQVAPKLPGVTIGAVAVGAGRAQTLALVRRNHWQIPIAFDKTGSLGQLYNVQVCPLIEVAQPGGVVTGRLIGDGWAQPGPLAAKLRALLRAT